MPRSSFSSASLFLLAGTALLTTACSSAESSLADEVAADERSEAAAQEESTGEASDALTTLSWAGYTWNVKSGAGLGPGPNTWSADNAFVDANGFLHLKITQSAGVWSSAEVYTTTNLGFGTYQWHIDAPLDGLDRNVVLGLFTYGPPTLGPDGTNEIDIEFAKWGSATSNPLWFTVYPRTGSTVVSMGYPFSLGGGTYTTPRFTWSSRSIAYAFMGGHQPVGTTTNVIQSWTYNSTTRNIPQSPMPLRMNLWLFQGQAPSNGLPVEVVIKGFSKT